MKKSAVYIALCLSTCAVTQAFGESSDSGCWSISDKDLRLACYDKAHNSPSPTAAEVKPNDSARPEQEEKTATTADLVKSKPTDPPKKIDADDLAIAPNKYIGKNLEISKVQCFYADKDEYRCIANSTSVILLIQSLNISPETEKQKIENECGEIKKMPTPACRRTLRFSPAVVNHDTVGLRDRTVVSTLNFEIVPAASGSRHR